MAVMVLLSQLQVTFDFMVLQLFGPKAWICQKCNNYAIFGDFLYSRLKKSYA
jgi:hypothetical protein